MIINTGVCLIQEDTMIIINTETRLVDIRWK